MCSDIGGFVSVFDVPDRGRDRSSQIAGPQALAENDGKPIVVSEHGLVSGERVEPDLPFLPKGAIAQLVRNGLLASEPVGAGRRVTYGPRTREICEGWGLTLPPESNESEAPAST
jgi:hypothetical protein